MKKYEKYRDSKNEWIGIIPNHWNSSKLKWLSDIYAGGTPSTKKDEYWENGSIPWLNSGTVNQKRITSPSNYITEEAVTYSSTKWVPKGSLLMALAGQGKTKGIVAILEIDATCNQSMAAIIPVLSEINNEYLFFWLDSNYHRIRGLAGTELRDGLNLEIVGDIICPIPSIDEQTKIARYLDYQTAIIDELIERKEKLIELLKEYKQSIINATVTKGLPAKAAAKAGLDPNAKMKDSGIEWWREVPEHWKVARIGHYTQLIRGASPRPAGDPRYFGGGFMPWITVGEVTNGDEKFVLSTENYLTKEGSELSRIIYPETLLLSNSGATLGVPKISKIMGCINDGSVAFSSLKKELERDFLFYFFKTHTEIYRQEMSGYGQPNLNTDIIKSTKFPLPPINEQVEIVNFIESEFMEFDKIISLSDLQIEKLKEYRQSIISEAVTGKIDVRDLQPKTKQAV
jgi:type I restriction enzyme, S subunit